MLISLNTEKKISEFVSYHLNPLVQTLPSYIKNTTHLLNKLKDIKRRSL